MNRNGRHAEDVAAAFLQQQGLKPVARDQVDFTEAAAVVARDGKTLVFVEVRMRTSAVFGGAAASITAAKRAKLLRTARHYLSGTVRVPACRFDALLVNGADNSVEWLKNAFGE